MTVRFAWPSYETPWAIGVTGIEVAGNRRMDVLDTGRRRLLLDQVDGWATAHIDITASTTEATPVEIDACDAIVVVSCTRTNVRIPFALDAAGPEHDARFEGRVVLERSVLAGAAELTVNIAATI